MILQSPGDVAFQIFGFPVYWYGIILAFACFLAVFIAKKTYAWVYCDGKSDLIWDVAPFVVILGIVGARLYYCLVNIDYYLFHPIEIFYIRGGGLSIHGGLIAGILALLFTARKYKIPFLNLLDVFSVGTVLAQSFGRWGNFFNNEAFGVPYDGFLKLYIPPSLRPEGFLNLEYYHPTFLYESLADFVIFLILLVVIKRFGMKFHGLTVCVYLMLYSFVRYFIEGIRLDSALNVGDFHIAQIISLIIFLLAIIGAVVILCKNNLKHN